MKNKLLEKIAAGKPSLAVLIDPEKCDNGPELDELLKKAAFAGIDYLFIGGSTVSRKEFEATAKAIKAKSNIPLVIFPGSSQQISEHADALLFLSLISGRNPDFLIGHQVLSAPELFELKELEVIPTGYLLIDGGTQSSVAYVSQTTPIPRDKHQIVRHTAMAGKLLGLKLIYLDAGSGARYTVPLEMIRQLTDLQLPVIVGGGVRSIDEVKQFHEAGASIVVIGNHLETDPDFLLDVHTYIKEAH